MNPSQPQQDARPSGQAETPATIAASIIASLAPGEIAYAASRERGEFRGFAALHDLMDANVLLPGCKAFDEAPDTMTDDEAEALRDLFLPLDNAVMEEVTRLLLAHPLAGLPVLASAIPDQVVTVSVPRTIPPDLAPASALDLVRRMADFIRRNHSTLNAEAVTLTTEASVLLAENEHDAGIPLPK